MDLSKGTLPVTLVASMIATIIAAAIWFSAKTNQVISSIDDVEDSVVSLGTELRREISDLRAEMVTRAENSQVLDRVRSLEQRVTALEAKQER